jgi:hypothetical protein
MAVTFPVLMHACEFSSVDDCLIDLAIWDMPSAAIAVIAQPAIYLFYGPVCGGPRGHPRQECVGALAGGRSIVEQIHDTAGLLFDATLPGSAKRWRNVAIYFQINAGSAGAEFIEIDKRDGIHSFLFS